MVSKGQCRPIGPHRITCHFSTRSLLPYDPYESPECLNNTLKITYGKPIESPIEANCVYYPRPKSYDCFDWTSDNLDEDLAMARSVALTQVGDAATVNSKEMPLKLTPQAMFMFHQALEKTNHSNEPLTTTRFLPCVAQHMRGFTRLRLAVNGTHADARLDEVAVISAIRVIQGCLTYPATMQRKLILQHFVNKLAKACTVPTTFKVLEKVVDIFVPNVVDPNIENQYISRALNVILQKLQGGAWRAPQQRLDASRYHLSKSFDKLPLTFESAAHLVAADKQKLLTYFSNIKSIRGQDIEEFVLTLLIR